MPLASVQLGKPCTGKSFTVLVESFPGIEGSAISRLLNGLVEVSQNHNPRHLEKSCVKMPCSFGEGMGNFALCNLQSIRCEPNRSS